MCIAQGSVKYMEHGQTITEKILAAHSGNETVTPGQIVEADIDVFMGHEVTTPAAISMLEQYGVEKVFDPERIVLVPDHFVPNKDIKSAELAKRLREFARAQHITNYYEVGRNGVCHVILPEKGFVLPGTTIVCPDSHTCTHGALGAFATGIGSTDAAAVLATGKLWFKIPESIRFNIDGKLARGVYSKDLILRIISDIGVDGALYQAMEFSGPTIERLSIESRMTVTNMAIEAGGKSGIIAADKHTDDYLKGRAKKPYTKVASDDDASYAEWRDYDVSDLEPMVAAPHLPSNGKPARLYDDVKIDQVVIGSCTNGRIEDLRIAADVLDGNTVADDVRMLVIPASTDVWEQAMQEGLFDTFVESGAAVSAPTCGPCLGGHMGILAKGERCVATTNRNFVGRMGHPQSEVYLASPATAAASGIAGRIVDPREYL
jgi:3-isopropylmalate/(R)-2-methylmalate dehydratase large subunit